MYVPRVISICMVSTISVTASPCGPHTDTQTDRQAAGLGRKELLAWMIAQSDIGPVHSGYSCDGPADIGQVTLLRLHWSGHHLLLHN